EELGRQRRILARPYSRAFAESARQIKQAYGGDGEQYSHDLQNKRDVVGVKRRHTNEGQKAGQHIDTKSAKSPWDELAQRSDRQLLCKTQIAQVHHSYRADQQ